MSEIEMLEEIKSLSPSEEAILTMLIRYQNLKSDLYEVNNRIADLLLTLGDRDRMINLMANAIYKMDCESEYGNSKEAIRKYFEERCK